MLTEANGIPIAVVVAGANRHDMKLLADTLEAVVVERPEPRQNDQEAPPLLCVEGRLFYRRRRKHRRLVATLFGPVEMWRRLYEPRKSGGRSVHPLELTLGIEAGLATPALAERVGRWATDHTQHQVLDMVEKDHGVHWSCTTLRKLLGSLRAGMAPHRHGSQVDQVVLVVALQRRLAKSFLHNASNAPGCRGRSRVAR